MVVLLICLVLVVVAIVVVIRLLLAELARSAAYRQPVARGAVLDDRFTVNPSSAKTPVRPRTGVAGTQMSAADPSEFTAEGGLLVEVPHRPRQREVRQVTRVYWWRRLRSGTALIALVALLGVATAAAIGAIVLVLALIVEQAIK